jgi:hypothetical protein
MGGRASCGGADMSRATLIAEDIDGGRQLTLDCPHGQTLGLYANGETSPVQLTDADVARALLLRHYQQERCRCTRHLRRRYGV